MKTKNVVKTSRNVLLSLAFIFPVASMAQSNPSNMQWDNAYFATIDTNKDGRISIEEYEIFMRDAFKKLDKDGNGYLTKAETADKLTEEQFTFLDKNKDSQVELDEFLDQLIAEFKQTDRDGDGYVSQR